jgi:hypothetical protein
MASLCCSVLAETLGQRAASTLWSAASGLVEQSAISISPDMILSISNFPSCLGNAYCLLFAPSRHGKQTMSPCIFKPGIASPDLNMEQSAILSLHGLDARFRNTSKVGLHVTWRHSSSHESLQTLTGSSKPSRIVQGVCPSVRLQSP